MNSHTKLYPSILSLALASLMCVSAAQVLAKSTDADDSHKEYSHSNGKSGHDESQSKEARATPNVYGKTIGNWGNSWWQWALNFSYADDPLLQDGNVDCAAGQSGKVWYLAGSFGGTLGEANPAERTCTIKKGKAIFFPIINDIKWTPLDPAVPEDCTDEANCRTVADADLSDVTGWTCTVDDVPCVWFSQIVRAQSDALPFDVLAGSILETLGYVPGVREVSVSDGYWVMLDSPPPGLHTIHFTAARASGFSLDITYHLTVK